MKGSAPLSALPARAWLTWLAGVLLLASVAGNPLFGLLLLLAVANVAAAAGVRPRALMGLAGTGALVVGLNALFSHHGVHVLGTVPGWIPVAGGTVTLEGVLAGLIQACRLCSIMLAFVAVFAAVDIPDTLAGAPRFLTHSGAAVSVALSVYPRIAISARQVREAQLARGTRRRGLRGLAPVLVPTLVNSLEDAYALAESMEARGFGQGARTRVVPPGGVATGRGATMAAPALAGGLLAVLLVATGGFPPYSPYSDGLLPPASLTLGLALLPLALALARPRVAVPA
ncbi:MAG: CbiQ family ECF transporter T component [Candidatus Dormibacteria bacterium]